MKETTIIPMSVQIEIDQFPIIEGLALEERKAQDLMISVLCKEDKEQMNRIESMLNEITPTLNNT